MIRTLLVANRGEIACRIFRTCRRLGIRTVAVFSDADAEAPHVRAADLALRIGPAPARESYLHVERILEAARRAGADAIHPGYGFLAEDASFAAAVRDRGLIFVGPPPELMRRLGDKREAKALAVQADVPVVPGCHGRTLDDAALLARAREIGFPLLVKAAAGGGGRGMRRVAREEELTAALEASRREAESAFGAGTLLLEKWIERPRHVEVQIFGDRHGHIVHLFERDCSLQRRHQKVLEETPAPRLPPSIRRRLHEAALAVARAAGYENAGTVEFLVEDDERFYFIEMNTRLQVEHPVTEAVTGLDLVEWQIRIAAGEPLPMAQEDIRSEGAAIEVRLYAECPEEGFRPAPGRITRLLLPSDLPGIRVDAGVAEGGSVSPHYDPMIAKIIAHGPDRPQALFRLRAALERTHVRGPATNLALLAHLLATDKVARGEVDTGWLEREGMAKNGAEDAAGLERLAAAAILAERLARPDCPAHVEPNSPWNLRTGFRPGAPASQRIALARGERELVFQATSTNGREWRFEGGAEEFTINRPTVAGARVRFEDESGLRQEFSAWFDGEEVTVARGALRASFALAGMRERLAEETESESLITAPLPGRVVAVLVACGQIVRRGEPVAVIEAMKMEQQLAAPHDGRIAELRVAAGDRVEEGAVVARIEREDHS